MPTSTEVAAAVYGLPVEEGSGGGGGVEDGAGGGGGGGIYLA